jgi:hypothetical protein
MMCGSQHHLVARQQHVAFVTVEGVKVRRKVAHAATRLHFFDQVLPLFEARPDRQRRRTVADHLFAVAFEQLLESRVDVDVQAVGQAHDQHRVRPMSKSFGEHLLRLE